VHFEWRRKALKAGKHVLRETPLFPTVAEMEEMIRTAEKNCCFDGALCSPAYFFFKNYELETGQTGRWSLMTLP